MTVRVYDNYGLNCVIKSKNALEIIKSILHGVRRNYVVIDYTHADANRACDYVVWLD